MQSRASNSTALAPTLMPLAGNRAIQGIILVLAGTALITIAAKIEVPFYPVPMTLQTLAIMLIAATYGFRLGTLTVIAYLAEGLVGLPVFANTPPAVAGPLYFLGTTGGFLVGFVVLAMIVGYAADRGWDRSIPKLFAAMVVGDVVVFVLGFIWLAWFAMLSSGLLGLLGLPEGSVGTGTAFAWAKGVVPFLLADLLKIALAALAIPAAWSLVGKRNS
jgi:biotin transport system substrate-specific component